VRQALTAPSTAGRAEVTCDDSPTPPAPVITGDVRGACSSALLPGAGAPLGKPSLPPVRTLLLMLLLILGGSTAGLAIETAMAADGIFAQDRLTGDWAGLRKQLQYAGIELGISDIAETLSNPIGGVKQTTIYQGLLTASLNLDLEKLANWPGASFYADAYQISGRGLSGNAIGNLLFVSTIEALPSTRLHDLWLQQEFLDRQASLRVGQIAVDDEFYISQYSANFVNSTFGCPDILSTDLPSGGSCYPLATPGVRLRAAPIADLTLSAAVFNGDPAPPGPGNPQVRNASGTNFLIGEGGFFAIAEFAYSFDVEPDLAGPLSGVKFGGWYHSADFADLRRDTLGRSLANPGSNGIAANHRGNFGLYLVVDKMLWRRPDPPTQDVAAFFRVGGAPADRNLISIEVDAGVTYKGLLPDRALDALGIAVSYARIGNAARRLDRDQVLFTGIERPIRNYETVLEITYEARISPWWLLQPDLQLVFHPGGHVANPVPAPLSRPIPNALVLGLRSTITF
jgi:porin